MKKKKKKEKKENHSEAKGLFLFIIAVLFFLSLASFIHKNSAENWLGIIGYSAALSLNYLFGFGSYLIIFFFGYLGYRELSVKKCGNLHFKIFCLFSFLISLCMLLNIFAENFPRQALFFGKKIFSDNVILHYPSPHIATRNYLGGVPLYYIYKDLPYFSLQKLLSDTGSAIIFFFLGFISFILFTGIKLIPNLKKGIEKIHLLIQTGFWKILHFFKNRKKKKEAAPLKKIGVKELNKKPEFQKIFKKPVKAQPAEQPPSFFKIPSKNSLPSTDLLSDPPSIDQPSLKKELFRQAEILQETLKSFSIDAKVGRINCGPTITSFEIHPSVGVKVQKIKALENDIALNLEAKSIRIIAPIPGKAAVGVEVPSLYPQMVSFKEMMAFYKSQTKKYNIPILLGKTVSGESIISDLTKMPHLLIAGATGSGKSVCINTIVMSILMTASSDEVKILMIDPKKVELTQYSELPHMIAPVITEPHGAYAALQWLVKEMQKRYDILKTMGLRNITAFNCRKRKKDFEESLDIEIPEKLPFFVAIIDEFADLMMVSSTDLETPIARLAQMARAVGIHVILATQRPSREVITGIIKANFPCRIAFKVSSRINSQIILDETGAESLLGNGDLLFLPPGTSHLLRAQGAYVSDEDIHRCIRSVTEKFPPNYLIPSFDAMEPLDITGSNARDELYSKALQIVLDHRVASTTYLQRKLKIGYARAASLMDELEENKIIGPAEGSKPRQILVKK